MKFTELPLSKGVLAGVEKAGFSDCTEVQGRVLPVTLTGKDVMVQSKTGSGKTAVYVLTILEKYEQAKAQGKTLPIALVVAPTRELAMQIEEDAQLLASNLPDFKVGCFYGGVGYGKQTEELSSGLSLYVGTPGRLLDFSQSHKIDFRVFDTFVLDEADRMFDMGFYPDIQKMFSLMRGQKERQTMLFSATLSTNVRNLAWQYMNDPEEIEVSPEEITVKAITQELFHVSSAEKFGLMLQLLAKIKPESCLVFTNTKAAAVEVSKRLAANGYKSAYLMGDMAQSDRIKTLEEMKEGKIAYLVATDVAARGLQIDDLQLVVNYDIPEDFEAYVHRIGRTARAGKSGKSITFADEEYVYGLEAIENYIQMKIPVLWADEQDLPVVEDKSAGMRFARRRSAFPQSRSGSRFGGPRRDGDRKREGDRRREGGRRSDSGANKTRRAPRRPSSDFPRRKDERIAGKDTVELRDAKPMHSKEEYKKLASLSLEERMALYRKEYSGKDTNASGVKKIASTAQKKPQQKRSNVQKNAVKPQMPRMSSAPTSAQASVKPEQKKRGFLAKVRSLFGGK